MGAKKKADENSLESIGRNAIASIIEMVEGLSSDDDETREEAERIIHEDALSIQVRSGWTDVGEPMESLEFCILLSTGGPATRIVGELNHHNEPHFARLEVQDWGTPWTEYHTKSDAEETALMLYVSCFCFGEG